MTLEFGLSCVENALILLPKRTDKDDSGDQQARGTHVSIFW